MKKGFTLVEVLAIIVIITVILLMAVPAYTGIISVIHQKVYESKISEVLAKSEMYSSDSSKIVFDIKALIEKGLLEPDNEAGEFKDPRTDRDMSCDIVNVLFQENHYESSITESEKCYTQEELDSLHGMVNLRLVDHDGKDIPKVEGTDWLKRKEVYITYELKEKYQYYAPFIEEILWYGESEKKCVGSELNDCLYHVSTNSLLQSKVNFLLKINVNGTILQNESSKYVLLDNVAPEVSSIRVVDDSNISVNQNRKVEFTLTDKDGAGVKDFGLSSTPVCEGVDYQNVKDGIQTVYLENGEYYICARDMVLNEMDSDDAENRKIIISNVDKTIPVIESIHLVSTAIGYNNLTPKATIDAYDGTPDNTSNLKMCVSTSNFLENCEWVPYSNTIDVDFEGDYDGGERILYVSIQDGSGNIVHKRETYRVYKYCDVKTSWNEIHNTSSSCPKCGDATFESTLQNKDKFFGRTCETKKESVTCDIPRDCCSKTVLSHYSWKSCSASCGGGTQTGDAYYVSEYDNTVSCGVSSNSVTQSCNTHACIEYRSRSVVPATSSVITKDVVTESLYSCSCTSGRAYLPNSTDMNKCPAINANYYGLCQNLTKAESNRVKCNPPTKEGYGGGKCIQYMEVYGSKFCVKWENAQLPNIPICTPSMTSTCPSGYTLEYPLCKKTTYSCPSGYSLSGTTCYGPWSSWSTTPISSSSSVEVETRKP